MEAWHAGYFVWSRAAMEATLIESRRLVSSSVSNLEAEGRIQSRLG